MDTEQGMSDYAAHIFVALNAGPARFAELCAATGLIRFDCYCGLAELARRGLVRFNGGAWSLASRELRAVA